MQVLIMGNQITQYKVYNRNKAAWLVHLLSLVGLDRFGPFFIKKILNAYY